MQERTFGAIDYGALEAGVMVMAVPCVALFLGAAAPLRAGLHHRCAARLSRAASCIQVLTG
jgi:hypothetical protein